MTNTAVVKPEYKWQTQQVRYCSNVEALPNPYLQTLDEVYESQQDIFSNIVLTNVRRKQRYLYGTSSVLAYTFYTSRPILKHLGNMVGSSEIIPTFNDSAATETKS